MNRGKWFRQAEELQGWLEWAKSRSEPEDTVHWRALVGFTDATYYEVEWAFARLNEIDLECADADHYKDQWASLKPEVRAIKKTLNLRHTDMLILLMRVGAFKLEGGPQ